MTLVQFAQRLASRYMDPGELNLLPGDAQLALCDAVNASTTEFYLLAPPRFRRGTVSFVLPAPATITGAQVTSGDSQLGAVVFSNDQRGCTVQLAGDPNWNEVAGPDALLDAYLGGTGTVQGTVYGNAAMFGAGIFSSLIGEPRIFRADHAQPGGHLLTRDESLRLRHFYCGQCRLGRPERYDIFPTALPGSGGDLFALRVHPMPDMACVVRVDADLQPLQFAVDDLTRSLELPVPEHHVLNILLPLAANALADMAGKYWRAGGRPPDVGAAKQRLQQLPRDFATPENYVGTPIGW